MRLVKYAFALALLPLWAADAAATIPVVVQGTPQLAPDRTITMTGVGTIKAMPDTAVVSGGVVTRARRSGEALRTNNEAMAKVVAALKALGITDKEITTASFSFEPQYETDSKGNIDPDRRIVGYSVENRIAVKLSERIERAGEVLDALIQNGANDTAGASFEFADIGSLNMRARTEAAKNALARAQAYVKPLGVELGAVRSVHEGHEPMVVNQIVAEDIGAFPDKNVADALQRVPGIPLRARIEASEQTISQSVTVTWALK